jgi:hypothetical protein
MQLPRLSEGADPALASAVADLRQHRPDAAELASLASRLALQGIAVTAPPSAAAAVAHAAWKKWLLAGGGAASGVALWLSLGKPSVTQAPAPPALLDAASVASASATAPPASSAARGGSVVTATNASPRADAAAATTAAAGSSARQLEPETPPISGIGSERVERDLGVAPRLESPARGVRSSATPPPTGSASGSSLESGPTAATEIELLRDARLALKQSPANALELAESHARAFPNGKLSQERELIAVSALAALGRRTAALSRAARFEKAFPESPYRRRIDELLR